MCVWGGGMSTATPCYWGVRSQEGSLLPRSHSLCMVGLNQNSFFSLSFYCGEGKGTIFILEFS